MFESSCSNLVYNKEFDAVVCIWKQSCDSEDYRNTMLAGLSILIKSHSETWITDFSTDIEEIPQDPEWFANVFLPQTINDHLKNLYFIVKPEYKVKAKVEEFIGLFSEFLNTKIFSSYEELKAELIKP